MKNDKGGVEFEWEGHKSSAGVELRFWQAARASDGTSSGGVPIPLVVFEEKHGKGTIF